MGWGARFVSKIAVIVFVSLLVAAAGYCFAFVDVRDGRLKKPCVLYGTLEAGMVPVKAAARADYLNKSVRSGVLRPIPDNVHDMLFFPVDIGSARMESIAIVTYNPWYPRWGGASPMGGKPPPYEKLRGGLTETEYEAYYNSIKCLIIGNGLFSKNLCDFELWYFKRSDRHVVEP